MVHTSIITVEGEAGLPDNRLEKSAFYVRLLLEVRGWVGINDYFWWMEQ